MLVWLPVFAYTNMKGQGNAEIGNQKTKTEKEWLFHFCFAKSYPYRSQRGRELKVERLRVLVKGVGVVSHHDKRHRMMKACKTLLFYNTQKYLKIHRNSDIYARTLNAYTLECMYIGLLFKINASNRHLQFRTVVPVSF